MGNENDAISHAIRDMRIGEYWYEPGDASPDVERVYRPAVLVDCRINFRSLKAGVNHSEERSYTAWLPGGSLPVDWDVHAVEDLDPHKVLSLPTEGVETPADRPGLSDDRFVEIEDDFVDTLVRRERFVLFYNPVFEIFSDGEEPLGDFLDRTAEVALQEIEPELKQLKHVYELQLGQVREAHLLKRGAAAADGQLDGNARGQAEVERMLQSRTEYFEIGTRITSLFTGLAGFVLQMPLARSGPLPDSGEALELREDLNRVEQEAADALNELYTRYLELVRSYDEFEVRIQPSNIRILRRALLWVPIEKARDHE